MIRVITLYLLIFLSAPLYSGSFSFKCLFQNLHIKYFKDPITPTKVSPHKINRTGLSRSHLSYSPLTRLSERSINPIEEVLRQTEIVELTPLGGGINSTSIATFKSGERAVWKPHIEEWHSNYRAEVLAYEIDQLTGFNIVPVTVERTINGKKGSLQLFKNSGAKSKLKDMQLAKQSLFDLIINNKDRHGGNYLASPTGEVISIDNGLSFTGHGRNGKTFFKRRPDIRRFMESEEGKKIMKNVQSIDLEKLEKEAQAYLGQQDTIKLIRRIRIAIKEFQKLK